MKGREGVLKGETGRRALDACVMSLYAALVSLVLGVVVLAYGRVDFYLKALRGEAALGHVPLMLIGAALLALALALTARLGRARVERLLGRYGAWLLAAGTLLMLAAQVFVCYHAYFMGVGDDGYFVFNTAMGYARREYTSVENAYLELYPNNATLAGVYGLMLRAVMALLGVEPGVERFRVLLILMQSAVNVTSGVLIAHLARRLTDSRTAAAGAWALYAGLIGCSPWYLIPYSDSTMLAVPLLLVALYMHEADGAKAAAQYALMGLLGGAAYLIKPQTCIPIIAVALYELASAAVTRQRVIATLAKLCAMGVACALVIGPGFALLKADMRIHTNPEASVGVSHFLNMGLNTDTDGAFAVDDLYAACAYDTKQERSRYCLSSAKARLQEMGPAGLAEHLLKKSLVNFADGTFAWCVDFSKREQPVKHETISPLIRSYVYWDGENSVLLRTMAQLFWQMVLLLCPFAVLIGAQGKTRRTLMVLMLSVVGMMAFNMLFEAKARYAYVISPLCVVLAAVGGAGVMRRLGKERAAGIEK